MTLSRLCAAVALAATTVLVAPTAAQAHTGNHPFKNCTQAYKNGYANIPKGDEHYGPHLDRDGDGIGCDKPPKDFTPAPTPPSPTPLPTTTATATPTATINPPVPTTTAPSEKPNDDNLAETGGNDTTSAIAGIATCALIAGGVLLFIVRRQRRSS